MTNLEAQSTINLLIEIADRGYLINNLYQLDNSSWRTNLRTPTIDDRYFATSFAEADTLSTCLSLALSEIESATPFYDPGVSSSIEPTSVRSLSSLLSNLRQTEPPIKRRI